MRLFNGDILAGFSFSVLYKCSVVLAVQFAGGIVRYVEQL